LGESGNPVERVRQQVGPLGESTVEVGWLVADIGDDGVALLLDLFPLRRLESRQPKRNGRQAVP
jgi:hypothetical protein